MTYPRWWTFVIALLVSGCNDGTMKECQEPTANSIRLFTGGGYKHDMCCAKVGPNYVAGCKSWVDGDVDFVVFGNNPVMIRSAK